MTDLERFAKFTLEQNDEWYTIEKNNYGALAMCKHKYMPKGQYNYFYNSPMYEVFNSKGKRICVSTNYIEAYNIFKNLKEI